MKKLEDLGLNEDQLKAVKEILEKKDKAHTDLVEENKGLKTQITERDNIIGELEKNKGNVEELTKQIEDYKTLEQSYKEQIEDNNYNNAVRDVIEQYKFTNSLTKDGLASKLKEAIKDTNNAGKSAQSLYDDLVKDMADIYKTEEVSNEPQVVIPPVGNTTPTDFENKLAQVMGL